MGERLFIADLHLSADHYSTVQLFLRFIKERAVLADELYILGDLFDSWIGDDDNRKPVPEVKKALSQLTQSGTRLFLQHGNRDFLLGRRFAKQTGATILHEEHTIPVGSGTALLMHGDLLCTDDVEYQQARKKLRHPLFILLTWILPLSKRIKIATDFRQRSKEVTANKSEAIMDVSQQTVEEYLHKHQTNVLIHGHTHRPAIHSFNLDASEAHRYVVGDWHPESAKILSLSEIDFQLETFT